jgi:hypothetical protein
VRQSVDETVCANVRVRVFPAIVTTVRRLTITKSSHNQEHERNTMTEQRSQTANLISSLRKQRDELKLQIHLGSKEAKQEWKNLDAKFQAMMADYEPVKNAVDQTAIDVWESLKLVAGEIKDGFHRIRKSL